MQVLDDKKVPRALICCIRSKRFISVASVPVSEMALALLTQISMPPNLATRLPPPAGT